MIGKRTFPGGKGNSFRNIINCMPPHKTYIEAFLGGGTILLKKKPALLNIGIEIDMHTFMSFLLHSGISNPTGGSDPSFAPTSLNSAVYTNKSGSHRLIRGCAINYLENLNPDQDTLIYLDPPYLPETRKSGKVYRHELTPEHHIRLLDIAGRLNCMVMISGYWSKMYEKALNGWNHIKYQTIIRSGAVVTEYLWFNYDKPSILHDYSWLGDTFRDRERLK